MVAAFTWNNRRLHALHQMHAGPGLLQAGMRLGVQAALVAGCLWSFSHDHYLAYAGCALASAVWYGGLLSLTHDALHHRLTGIVVLDDLLARVISWPLAWPIGVYTRVHLAHHRWSGGDFKDPERIQPTRAEYDAAAPVTRWYFRNQIWFNVFIAGGVGLLTRVALDAWRSRAHISSLRRYALVDAGGFLAVTGTWIVLAYVAGGWRLVAAAAGLWAITERVVGAAHQTRNHAEHYGLWGARSTRVETQYQNARDINAHGLAAWYFNHLNRHATHHALVGVPFYNLEAAHEYLRDALNARAVTLLQPRGYLAEALAAHRLARREGFIEDQVAEPV